jgi:hypothetical protein
VPPEAGALVKVSTLFKALVSLGLLALVFSRIDGAAAWASLRGLGAVTLLSAILLAFVAYVPRAWRWQFLLRRFGIPLPGGAAYRLTLVGILYGLVTPGRIGELARVVHLPGARTRALPSVIWDRLSDVVLLEVTALPGLVAMGEAARWLWWVYLAIVTATVAVLAMLGSRRLHAALARVPPLARVAEALEGGAGVAVSPAFAQSLGAGLLFYAVNFAAAFVLLRALAPEAAMASVLVFPVIILLGNLPIAFGGLGVREYFAGVALAPFAVAPDVGPVFSLTWFVVMTVLPGLAGLAAMHLAGRFAAVAPSSEPLAPNAQGDRR